ncbi:MAG TPA: hypothetical protein VFZ34_25885 [Blastocatellia bacterium]|nr:hypothetical protein [Blastocatellia bacterium]
MVLPFPQPLAPPSKATNSTFHNDHSLPSPVEHHSSQERIRRQLVAKALSSRWYQDHLALPQSAPMPTTDAAASGHDPANDPTKDPQRMKPSDNMRFQWKPALSQAMLFLWIEHGFRFATEPGTRAELRGPFFKDWFNSVKRTRGWRDGDPFIVNYVGHPMQGSVTNYIFVHNDPKSLQVETGFNKAYVKSRLKAMLFSTVYSTQFELGLLGEAALGNVGLEPSKTARHPSAFVDLVITPTLGTVWMIGEDALDRLVVQRMENHVENRVVRLLVRSFLNPSRSFANALRGRYPWYRDGRRL